MKRIFFIACIALLTFNSNAQFTKAKLQATGLTCAMCSNAINKALLKVPFVQSVHADISHASFDIVFKSNTDLNIDAIRTAVEDAGFSIGKLDITGTFNAVKIANDEQVKIGNEQFHFLDVSSRVLNGEQTLTVIDKNFVTAKEFKKFSAATKMSCVNSGKDEAGQRIYHVTI